MHVVRLFSPATIKALFKTKTNLSSKKTIVYSIRKAQKAGIEITEENNSEGMDAFYTFLEDLDTTPEDVLRRFAIRNLLLDYELGDEFEDTVDVEEFIEDFDTYDSGRDGIEEMAVQYLLIRDSDEYTFELDNDDLTMVVVGINPDDDEVDIYDIGTEGTVDTDPYDYTYIIIMNTNQHDDPDDCSEEDWELEVSNGSRDDFAEPNGEEFDVSNFDPAD